MKNYEWYVKLISMSLSNFNYSISWSDFTPQPSRPHGADEDAFTKVRFHHSYNYARNGNVVTVTDATVDITMVTQQCWVVSGKTTNDLLQHEQGHFDITALGAKQFYNALLSITARSIRDMETSISQAHEKYQQKIDRANIRYDSQTNHSQNVKLQQQWDQSIAAEKQSPTGSIDNLPQ